MIGILLTLAGCWFYFGSTLIGGGVHLDPLPGWGMLIAGVALVPMIGGYPFGGGGVWVYEAIRRVQIFEPVELSFRVGYGTLSALSFVISTFGLQVKHNYDSLSDNAG